jgi:hypothetical protein
MAQDIQLEQIPLQKVVITLGENNYDIRIYSIVQRMAYDLTINGVIVIKGLKFVNEVLMLPYSHQEVNGNILLILPDDELPDYKLFGVSQFLTYLDASETLLYRNRVEVL